MGLGVDNPQIGNQTVVAQLFQQIKNDENLRILPFFSRQNNPHALFPHATKEPLLVQIQRKTPKNCGVGLKKFFVRKPHDISLHFLWQMNCNKYTTKSAPLPSPAGIHPISLCDKKVPKKKSPAVFHAGTGTARLLRTMHFADILLPGTAIVVPATRFPFEVIGIHAVQNSDPPALEEPHDITGVTPSNSFGIEHVTD